MTRTRIGRGLLLERLDDLLLLDVAEPPCRITTCVGLELEVLARAARWSQLQRGDPLGEDHDSAPCRCGRRRSRCRCSTSASYLALPSLRLRSARPRSTSSASASREPAVGVRVEALEPLPDGRLEGGRAADRNALASVQGKSWRSSLRSTATRRPRGAARSARARRRSRPRSALAVDQEVVRLAAARPSRRRRRSATSGLCRWRRMIEALAPRPRPGRRPG